jgi:polyphosphate kinase
MEKKYPHIHRDISWLGFNYRVLQEAKDRRVPLLEKVKFLAIYSSNLDEFYKVRVSALKNLVRISKTEDLKLTFDPRETLKEIRTIVSDQLIEFNRIFEKEIIPELGKHNIRLLRRLDIKEEQKQFIEAYFHDNLLPFVQPVLLVKKRIRAFLNNGALFLAVHMRPNTKFFKKSKYALVKIPSDHLPRFVKLPSPPGYHDLIMLDDVVRHSVSWLFPGFTILDTYSIKLTRDAEMYIEDEDQGDIVEMIKEGLKKRNVGDASRFVYDKLMPEEMLAFLMEDFGLKPDDLLPEGRYHNNFDFFKFPDFGLDHLKNEPMPALPNLNLENASNIFDVLKKRDQLIHFPYHSYNSVVRFFEEASKDPDVLEIKIVQYRVAKESKIMEALMEAAENGKKVTTFVEVKARFDEEANITWGEKLSKSGVNVHYSIPGLKVHAKVALVLRREGDKLIQYGYLSTGNFNEDTARIYSDFGLFTANTQYTLDMEKVFQVLEGKRHIDLHFNHLLVGQYNLRLGLVNLIESEIKEAKAGRPAWIQLKMNSLQDEEMIGLLYEASQAGVKIDLIIRGICCLVPGLKGYSENITGISIVDRYLEHSRIFRFCNANQTMTLMSSADWMVRNLSHRIETAFPIFDPELSAKIEQIFEFQLRDNVKGRYLDKRRYNQHVFPEAGEESIRSQTKTYEYIEMLNNMIIKQES